MTQKDSDGTKRSFTHERNLATGVVRWARAPPTCALGPNAVQKQQEWRRKGGEQASESFGPVW